MRNLLRRGHERSVFLSGMAVVLTAMSLLLHPWTSNFNTC